MTDAPNAVPHEVVVVGGTNVDIKSRADGPLVAGTSNPGTTRVAAGGVGRNVAEALARLGVRTLLVSAVGDDALAATALDATVAAGVDVSAVQRVRGATTGTYHAVLDEHGDLAVAVSSMQATESLTVADVRAHEPAIARARFLVADANIPTAVLVEALELATRHRVPVALEPVSVAKAARLASILDPARPVALLTPNADELAALAGAPVARDDLDAIAAACAVLHRRGVSCVTVRLGASGTCVAAAAGHAVLVPTRHLPDVADVTGAGDAALAGHLWAVLHRDADHLAAARAANATAHAVLRAGGIARAAIGPATIDALIAELQERP